MINVVGGGLAGSMVAKELTNRGIQHRVFDSGELFAASKISENLFSPTWLKGAPYLETSMRWLTDNYQVEVRRFQTNKSHQEVFHIPINRLLCQYAIPQRVTRVTDGGVYCGSEFYAGVNVLCTGYFTKRFVRIDSLNSLTGHGILFEPNDNNNALKETMRHYRPFTHEKIIRWYDGRVWYGDSTTILHDKYLKNQSAYLKETLARAKAIGLTGAYKVFYGARPFINTSEKKYGLFKRLSDNNYVLTGGWKDGLVIYPYLVRKLMADLTK